MPDRPDALTDFTPATPAPRRDGWSVARQRTFIQTLADTGSVTAAAEAAGMSARSAYRLRHSPGAEAFSEAWDQAMIVAGDRLLAIAYERAIHGEARPVRHKGEIVGEERRPSDRLLMFLLTHMDSMRFGKLSGLAAQSVRDPRQDADSEVKRLVHHFTDAEG